MWKFILLSLSVLALVSKGSSLAIDGKENEVDFGEKKAGDLNSTFLEANLKPSYITLLVNNKMFHIIYTQLNWHSAAEYCSSQNLMLASIDNSQENDKLLQQLGERGLLFNGASFWLGASDLGHTGKWSWLSNGRPLLYRNWSPGEPNNYRGIEHCLQLVESGKWNDIRCDNTNGVICENRCPLDSYSVPLYTK